MTNSTDLFDDTVALIQAKAHAQGAQAPRA